MPLPDNVSGSGGHDARKNSICWIAEGQPSTGEFDADSPADVAGSSKGAASRSSSAKPFGAIDEGGAVCGGAGRAAMRLVPAQWVRQLENVGESTPMRSATGERRGETSIAFLNRITGDSANRNTPLTESIHGALGGLPWSYPKASDTSSVTP